MTIFVDAGRIFVGHWPQLLGLFLAGWAGRMGILWLTVIVSNYSPTVAVLMLPLAPMCTLLSMVMMLRVVARSLPAFAGSFNTDTRQQRWTAGLESATQVLLPFLAVYASQGMLAEDTRAFLYDSFADEWYNASLTSMDFGRASYAEGLPMLAMIVTALVLRKIITVLDLTEKSVWWALGATYLEVLWLVTFARALSSQIEDLANWLATRRLTAPLLQWWNEVSSPVISAYENSAPKVFIDWLGTMLAGMGNLVLVPVAWMAIGATVYGASLARGPKIESHEEVTKRIAKVPNPVRRAVAQTLEPVTTPVRDTVSAIGKVAAAGVVPMVLFCLVFVIASQVKVLAAVGFRAAVGPRDPDLWFALEPYSLMFQRLFYFTLALVLLAAAVSSVVMAQRARSASPRRALPDDDAHADDPEATPNEQTVPSVEASASGPARPGGGATAVR